MCGHAVAMASQQGPASLASSQRLQPHVQAKHTSTTRARQRLRRNDRRQTCQRQQRDEITGAITDALY